MLVFLFAEMSMCVTKNMSMVEHVMLERKYYLYINIYKNDMVFAIYWQIAKNFYDIRDIISYRAKKKKSNCQAHSFSSLRWKDIVNDLCDFSVEK